MENIRTNLSKNLIRYRKKANLTQSELADILNYSDKAVSKWERGESVPDIEIIYAISQVYGVKVDDLLDEPNEKNIVVKPNNIKIQHFLITVLSVCLVWLIATVIYVTLAIVDANKPNVEMQNSWLAFIYAIPLSAIVALIFNWIWGNKHYNIIIITIILWTIVLCLYLTSAFARKDLLFIITIPVQILVTFWHILIIIKDSNKKLKKERKE